MFAWDLKLILFSFVPSPSVYIRSLYDYMKTWGACMEVEGEKRIKKRKKETSILFRMFYPCSGGTKQRNQWMGSLSLSALKPFFYFFIYCIFFFTLLSEHFEKK